MKLRKIKSVVNGKDYFKYNLTLKRSLVEELEWKEQDNIEQKVSKGKLILEKKQEMTCDCPPDKERTGEYCSGCKEPREGCDC